METIFDDSVQAIEQGEARMRVQFRHAAPKEFDLVIGADGLHSAVRSIAFGPEGRFERYLGYYAASFCADGYPHRHERAYVCYSEPGRQVARYALRGGRTAFFFLFRRSERLRIAPHDLAAQKAVLRDVFQHDGWECREILEALCGSPVLYFDVVSQIRMDRWSCGRTALVGDACSCPSLLAGEGAALAMAGAYVLARELKRAGGDHLAAFCRYEHALRPLVTRKQRAAESFAAWFAPSTGIGIFARNQVTRLVSIPAVSDWLVRRMVADQVALPDYRVDDRAG